MSDKLQDAIAAITTGDKTGAKKLLVQALTADPRNETAWLWMTQVVDTKQQRIDCLQNVLKINPANESAKTALAALRPEDPNRGTAQTRIQPAPEKQPFADQRERGTPTPRTGTTVPTLVTTPPKKEIK